ncbi:MAG: membrane protein insertase YidC, partial [Acidobacteriaceae bacterium]
MAEYKNPNQHGGKQDTSTLLVFTIVFVAILLGMQVFRPKHPAATNPAHPAHAAESTAAKNTSTLPTHAGATGAGASTTTSSEAGKRAVPATPRIAAAQETTTTVENELYRITFSNRGGEVVSWVLKKYTDNKDKPLDLVNSEAAKQFGYPLSIYTSDADLRQRLNEALYVPSATGKLMAPNQLTFTYSGDGLTVHKTFHFDSSYVVRADVSVTDNGAPIEALLAWPAGFGDQREARDYSSYQKIDRSNSGKVESISPKKVSDGEAEAGPLDWGG